MTPHRSDRETRFDAMCKREMSKLSKSISKMRSATKRDLRNAFDCALCGHPLEFKTKSEKRWWRKWIVVK